MAGWQLYHGSSSPAALFPLQALSTPLDFPRHLAPRHYALYNDLVTHLSSSFDFPSWESGRLPDRHGFLQKPLC
jgi:hypothetical protein